LFFIQSGAFGFAVESAEVSICADHTVAWDFGSEGVACEGGADGAGGAALEAFGDVAVGGDFPGWDVADDLIDRLFELGGRPIRLHHAWRLRFASRWSSSAHCSRLTM
jgi:hypothetical protein